MCFIWGPVDEMKHLQHNKMNHHGHLVVIHPMLRFALWFCWQGSSSYNMIDFSSNIHSLFKGCHITKSGSNQYIDVIYVLVSKLQRHLWPKQQTLLAGCSERRQPHLACLGGDHEILPLLSLSRETHDCSLHPLGSSTWVAPKGQCGTGKLLYQVWRCINVTPSLRWNTQALFISSFKSNALACITFGFL